MKDLKLKGKSLENMHKMVFLANEYPNETTRELGDRFLKAGMPLIDVNLALWRAEESGYLVVDPETYECKVDRVPEKWELGDAVQQLSENIVEVLTRLNAKEGDIEEQPLSMWVAGYEPYDYLIAIKKLLNDRVVGSYTITNTTEQKPSKKGVKRGKKTKLIEDEYTFYSLWDNVEQQWGKKQFKDQSKLK